MRAPLLQKKHSNTESRWTDLLPFLFVSVLIVTLCFSDSNIESPVGQGGTPSSSESSDLAQVSGEKLNEDRHILPEIFDTLTIEPPLSPPPLPSPILASSGAVPPSPMQSQKSSSPESQSGDDDEKTQSRRFERFNRQGKPLLLSPIVVSMADALSWDPSRLPSPPHTPDNKIKDPASLIPWATLSEFKAPIKGGKNLFVTWLGADPPPIIHAFVHSMYVNRGEFSWHLITSDNLQQYMTLEVDGRQICPNLDTRLPEDTYISYHVWFRVWSAPIAELPLATRKDFIVNVLIAVFGGAFMDPGLLGKGKLDYWWDEVMQKENVDYINYSFGDEWDIAAGARHLSLAMDKEGRGKWSGQLWIDVFFSMVKADAPIMQTYLHFIHDDPKWGPMQSQANNSPYFIYGGDVLDACFNSVYDWNDRRPFKGNKMGIAHYGPLPEESPPGSGYNSDEEFSASGFFDQLDESLLPKDVTEVVDLFEEFDRQLERRPPPQGHRDPPKGLFLKDVGIAPSGQAAIMFNLRARDSRFSATQIPQPQYQFFSHPLYPDFETMLSTGHPGALNAEAAIDTLNAPEGGIYLKFYGTAEDLKDMSWEKLCGPPRSLIMFMIQSLTGEDLCTGEKVPLLAPSEKWMQKGHEGTIKRTLTSFSFSSDVETSAPASSVASGRGKLSVAKWRQS